MVARKATNEVQVSKEMIDAGALILEEYVHDDGVVFSFRDIAEFVYRAMSAACVSVDACENQHTLASARKFVPKQDQ